MIRNPCANGSDWGPWGHRVGEAEYQADSKTTVSRLHYGTAKEHYRSVEWAPVATAGRAREVDIGRKSSATNDRIAAKAATT